MARSRGCALETAWQDRAAVRKQTRCVLRFGTTISTAASQQNQRSSCPLFYLRLRRTPRAEISVLPPCERTRAAGAGLRRCFGGNGLHPRKDRAVGESN